MSYSRGSEDERSLDAGEATLLVGDEVALSLSAALPAMKYLRAGRFPARLGGRAGARASTLPFASRPPQMAPAPRRNHVKLNNFSRVRTRILPPVPSLRPRNFKVEIQSRTKEKKYSFIPGSLSI